MSLAAVIGTESGFSALCRHLDPDSVPLADAPAMLASLANIEKLAAGARVRLARRAEASGQWRRDGYRSFPEWLARTTGTSTGTARSTLDTSKRITDLPDTEAALRNGDLSEAQANTVSDAANANPGAERGLVNTAKVSSVKDLREAAGKAKARADTNPEATHRRQHANRSCRTWTDSEGLFNLHLRNTPEIGAELTAILEPFLNHVFHQARRAGRHESRDAYAADAVTNIFRTATGASAAATPATAPDAGDANGDCPVDPRHGTDPIGSPGPNRPRAGSLRPDRKVIAFIDWQALVRGRRDGEETCEIAGLGAGLGAVPVSTVRAMLGDATLALVIRDGVDVLHVTHLGRAVTAHQRTALEARGYRCCVPGCGSRFRLEIDHITGWAVTQTTELHDLDWLCHHHHHQKTHCGYRITGPPGRRTWHHPDGTIDEAQPEGAEGTRAPPNHHAGRLPSPRSHPAPPALFGAHAAPVA